VGLIKYYCDVCHKPVFRYYTRRVVRCGKCRDLLIASSIKQLRNKRGAIYNKWKNNLITSLEKGRNNGKE